MKPEDIELLKRRISNVTFFTISLDASARRSLKPFITAKGDRA